MFQFLLNIDNNILFFIQEHLRTNWLTPIMIWITNLGNSGFIALVACISLTAIKKTRKIGYMSTFSLLINFIITNLILKNVVARIRPYEVLQGLDLLVKNAHDYSFPSGHTSSVFAVSGIIFLTCPKKVGIPALLFGVLMGYSRLYVGIHYPSDVLAGAVVGLVCSYLVYRSCAMLYK